MEDPYGPWSAAGATPPEYGTTQPITPAALDYVREALQRVRDSEAVAIVKFSYDGQGYTYIDSGIYDQVIHDSEPGAPQGRVWYETGIPEESDLVVYPVTRTKTGYNIIFGSLEMFSANSKIP